MPAEKGFEFRAFTLASSGLYVFQPFTADNPKYILYGNVSQAKNYQKRKILFDANFRYDNIGAERGIGI